MTKGRRSVAALLLAASICLGLGGCGTGDGGLLQNGDGSQSLPATVSVQSGTIVTDSWGYSGAQPVQVMSPVKAQVLLNPHTLLLDASNYVVSGIVVTKVTFSSDPTTLPQAAQNSAPGVLVCYLELSLGVAKSAAPALPVTVDAGAVPAGTALTAYSFNSGTGKWSSAQSAVVDGSGKITFQASQCALWAVFR